MFIIVAKYIHSDVFDKSIKRSSLILYLFLCYVCVYLIDVMVDCCMVCILPYKHTHKYTEQAKKNNDNDTNNKKTFTAEKYLVPIGTQNRQKIIIIIEQCTFCKTRYY